MECLYLDEDKPVFGLKPTFFKKGVSFVLISSYLDNKNFKMAFKSYAYIMLLVKIKFRSKFFNFKLIQNSLGLLAVIIHERGIWDKGNWESP